MDYKEIGFRCGIEIHQQLDTKKLFCNCPSIVHDRDPDIRVIRRLRPVAGETGETDKAAVHEMKKGRTIIYEACSTSSCLIELDEEPPMPIRKECVEIALQLALMMGMKAVDEVQVMRKTVVDGSNVSGFQRTALIAVNGSVKTSRGDVRIETLCLEEEAAKKIKEDDKTATYRLDRLGVPLIEIATDASIKDPEHARETATVIGMILRSTGRVKRGIGTIRQDVNISVRGSSRVEIKGFQDIKNMPMVISREILRLKKLEKHSPEVRKVNKDSTTSFLRPMPGAARMYPETDVLPFRADLSGIKAPKLITQKAKELEKSYSLSKELSNEIVNGGKEGFFRKLAENSEKLEPRMIADVLINIPKEIKKRMSKDASCLKDDDFAKVIQLLDEGRIAKEAVIDLLSARADGRDIDEEAEKFRPVSDEELLQKLKELVSRNPKANLGALMGMAMKRFRGKADGRKISEILRKLSD